MKEGIGLDQLHSKGKLKEKKLGDGKPRVEEAGKGKLHQEPAKFKLMMLVST